MNTPGLLPVREAANLLGVSTRTIRRRIDDGSLPSFRLGDGPSAAVRIAPADLARYLADATHRHRKDDR